MDDLRKQFSRRNAQNKASLSVSSIVRPIPKFNLHWNNLNVAMLYFTCILILRNMFVYKNPKHTLSTVTYYAVLIN